MSRAQVVSVVRSWTPSPYGRASRPDPSWVPRARLPPEPAQRVAQRLDAVPGQPPGRGQQAPLVLGDGAQDPVVGQAARSIWFGPPAPGVTSKSKIAREDVQRRRALGMSTTWTGALDRGGADQQVGLLPGAKVVR